MILSFKRIQQVGIGALLGIILLLSITTIAFLRVTIDQVQHLDELNAKNNIFHEVTRHLKQAESLFQNQKNDDEFDIEQFDHRNFTPIRTHLEVLKNSSRHEHEVQIAASLTREVASIRTNLFAYASALEFPFSDNGERFRTEVVQKGI